MIKFDSTHTTVDGKLEERLGKRLARKILASGLIVANLFTFSACAKTQECDIPETHAHYYTNEYDFGRYIVSEKETVDGLTRTDNYKEITKEQEDLLRFLNRNRLYRIDENYEAIKNVEDQCQDYKEYKNEDMGLKFILMPSGFKLFPTMKDKWDENPGHNYTGEERTNHFMFYGYKVIDKGNGNYKLERSDYVDSIDDLPAEYEYVSQGFTVVVNDYDNSIQISPDNHGNTL